jgi:hypothetical protein
MDDSDSSSKDIPAAVVTVWKIATAVVCISAFVIPVFFKSILKTPLRQVDILCIHLMLVTFIGNQIASGETWAKHGPGFSRRTKPFPFWISIFGWCIILAIFVAAFDLRSFLENDYRIVFAVIFFIISWGYYGLMIARMKMNQVKNQERSKNDSLTV